MLDVAALRIGFPWTFHFFRLRTGPMLPKRFVIFVPLFCRLLPYEGTLMLPTLFEMLVRSAILLVLPYAQGPCCPKLSEHGS